MTGPHADGKSQLDKTGISDSIMHKSRHVIVQEKWGAGRGGPLHMLNWTITSYISHVELRSPLNCSTCLVVAIL